MSTVCLTIDLKKITDNTRKTLAICRQLDLEVVGVTKGVFGMPQVARAMLAGGIEILGDARLDNIARMREYGILAPMVLLRSPVPSEVSQCIDLVDRIAFQLGHFALSRLMASPYVCIEYR